MSYLHKCSSAALEAAGWSELSVQTEISRNSVRGGSFIEGQTACCLLGGGITLQDCECHKTLLFEMALK